ncbi:MAG: UDP-N-acetyl-D-mannosamine dehydrogenase [Deltaproteobacteria bacterium]|nr:UDP-N-acetyl-D-mannosamine dehydrogenase [Deltaproteobacteria bacterium]
MSFNTISVIGLGYIGLPTAAMIASRRVPVIGVDINREAVETINQGRIHIVEPELDILVHACVSEGFLRATTTPEKADAFVIAVPTPFMDNHKPDLSYVRAATEAIAPFLEAGNLIILESTSPVGTLEKMVDWLKQVRPDLRFPGDGAEEPQINLAYCPERVLPGHVVRELVENDRIIGGITAACSDRACEFYRIFVKGELLRTNSRTAEMAKLVENSFRDVNIAFANELSMICQKLDINVWDLIRLANHHPRVNILRPGAGVGGHCIAVDPWFIVDSAPEESRLIRTAREVNDHKPEWVLEQLDRQVELFLNSNPERKGGKLKLGVLGLAFKPDIDDLRESPALEIAQKLTEKNHLELLFVEPNIKQIPTELSKYPLVDLPVVCEKADILIVLVAHREFSKLSENISPEKVVLDVVGELTNR